MKPEKFDILIVGVGGQGVLLASEILSEVAVREGWDLKKSEVHGMSQRGGVVSSHVRIGRKVFSPTISQGETDIMLSFEQSEGLRAVDWLHPESIAIVADTKLVPAIITSSKDLSYPDDPVGALSKKIKQVILVEADRIAQELGNARLVNTILLGRLSKFLPFKAESWAEVIRARVKERYVTINLTAFERGLEAGTDTIVSGDSVCHS